MSSTASGVGSSWINSTGGFYEGASNWAPTGVPAATNDVIFGLPGDYAVGFLGDQTAASLTIANNANIRFGIGGTSSTDRRFRIQGDGSIENAGLEIDADPSGGVFELDLSGDLDLTGAADLFSLIGSARVNNSTTRINGTTSNGQALLSGDSATWEMTGELFIGQDDSAKLRIEDGAVVTNRSVTLGGTGRGDISRGRLEVSGIGSDGSPSILQTDFNLFVGSGGGVGELLIDGGALVQAGNRTQLANGVGSEGYVAVAGGGGVVSTWNTGLLTLGLGGVARVAIESGGVTNSESATVGQSSFASVDVLGGESPTEWNIGGELKISVNSGGRVDVTDGARLSAGSTSIGLATGTSAVGQLFVLGGLPDDSTTVFVNSGDLNVGGSATTPEATGSIAVSGDARADIGGVVRIWEEGSVRISLGARFAADTIDHTHGGVFDLQQGTLHVGRFDGDLVNAAGAIAPGVDNAAGLTTIFGDYLQERDGKLSIGIGGIGAGAEYDLVTVTGDGLIDGSLEVALIEGFQPDANDEFIVFAADTLFGVFDNVTPGGRLDTIDGLGSFVVNYGVGSAFDESRVVLSDFQPSGLLPGDYNGNGIVDAADYSVWRDNLGAPAGTLLNDVDGGEIGLEQYETWRANYGVSATASAARSGVATVPEPGTLCLAALTAMSFTRRLMKGQSRRI